MLPKTMDELFDAAAKVGADGQGDFGIYGSPSSGADCSAARHGRHPALTRTRPPFDFADNEAAINYVTRLSELLRLRR